MYIIDNDLLSIQEARILIENAREAQKLLSTFPQEKLDAIVEAMAAAVKSQGKELAILAQEETDYGRWQDKELMIRFISEAVPTKLREIKCVGIIKEDPVNGTMEVGVPMGVIVALSPATTPVPTTLYKALIAIKSGNAIVFAPHPRAKRTIGRVIDLMIQAAEKSGLPAGALSYLSTVTPAGAQALMEHPDTALIINTGVSEMLKAAYRSRKPVIYGGNGHGPAFIEGSANIQQAVADIIASKTFDNGLNAGTEQAIVVDSCIATAVKQELQKKGAYFMTAEEAQRLATALFSSNGSLDPEMIGKSAEVLAKRAGFTIPEGTVLLIAEQQYVSDSNPYSREILCPVLAFYIEADWLHACEKCIELLLKEKLGHTLVIHSQDEGVIHQFALKKPVGRVLVNTPAAFGCIGATTNLFPALTLGSGSTGEGITSDNVSPSNLVYIRRVGYGVRAVEELFKEGTKEPKETMAHQGELEAYSPKTEAIELLHQLVATVLKEIRG